MIDSQFEAAVTMKELEEGEASHNAEEESRRIAMAAELTSSSAVLTQAWEKDSKLYMTTLKGAIRAYEENTNLEELLRGCIARLISVVDAEDGAVEQVIEKALEIVLSDADEESLI
jgi:hypothetical protein